MEDDRFPGEGKPKVRELECPDGHKVTTQLRRMPCPECGLPMRLP